MEEFINFIKDQMRIQPQLIELFMARLSVSQAIPSFSTYDRNAVPNDRLPLVFLTNQSNDCHQQDAESGALGISRTIGMDSFITSRG